MKFEASNHRNKNEIPMMRHGSTNGRHFAYPSSVPPAKSRQHRRSLPRDGDADLASNATLPKESVVMNIF
jgi:hypothetical protein